MAKYDRSTISYLNIVYPLEINFPGTRMWAQTFVTQGRIKSTVK